MKILSNSIWLITFLCSAIASAEWSQWRGPNRDGVLTEFSAPEVWPKQLKRIWRVEVGGGDGSPVVSGKRIYVHTRAGENEVVTALDLDTGALLWQDSYKPAPYMWPWHGAESRGKGPFSTPTLADGKLLTLGVTQALSAYDAKTGQLLWRRDFKKHLDFGSSTSPIVVDGLCIVHIGEPKDGALTAFDAATGNVIWRWDGDGPSYASPILVELAGTEQLVALTRRHCIGISPTTGELFWKTPFIHPWGDENIPTPLRYGEMFILSAVEKGTTGFRVSKSGSEWAAEQVWHNPKTHMYTNSPVLSRDLLYGFSTQRKGQFFCLNPRTGKTLWTSEGREGEYASIVSAGEILFGLTGDAELIIFKRSAERFEPIARYTVADSPTWAHPIISNQRMLIKDASTLTLWSMEDDSESPDADSLQVTAEPLPPPTIDTETIIWEKEGAEMALIPAGDFQMGSDTGGDSDEKPIHTVYLDAFYIDKYEVTNAQYRKFVQATGYPVPKYWNDDTYNQPKQPVVGAMWYDAMAYAQWAGKRLPTEAEWEKAARGGWVGKKYPWGDSIDEHQANYDGNVGHPISIGTYQPNGYGLYDMAGNVWEWCLDEYQEDFYAKSPGENPLAGGALDTLLVNYKSVRTQRVLRGGASDTYDNLVRVSNRNRDNPVQRHWHYHVGFRCVSPQRRRTE